MEALIIIIASYTVGMITQMLRNTFKKDDGEVWINDERCEVIFKTERSIEWKQKKEQYRIC